MTSLVLIGSGEETNAEQSASAPLPKPSIWHKITKPIMSWFSGNNTEKEFESLKSNWSEIFENMQREMLRVQNRRWDGAKTKVPNWEDIFQFVYIDEHTTIFMGNTFESAAEKAYSCKRAFEAKEWSFNELKNECKLPKKMGRKNAFKFWTEKIKQFEAGQRIFECIQWTKRQEKKKLKEIFNAFLDGAPLPANICHEEQFKETGESEENIEGKETDKSKTPNEEKQTEKETEKSIVKERRNSWEKIRAQWSGRDAETERTVVKEEGGKGKKDSSWLDESESRERVEWKRKVARGKKRTKISPQKRQMRKKVEEQRNAALSAQEESGESDQNRETKKKWVKTSDRKVPKGQPQYSTHAEKEAHQRYGAQADTGERNLSLQQQPNDALSRQQLTETETNRPIDGQQYVEGETAPTAAQIIHRTEKIDDGKVSTEDDDGGEIVMDTDGGEEEIVGRNNSSRGKKDGERQQQTQGERQEKQRKKTNSAPKKTMPAEVQQPNAQSAVAAVSPPQLHSFGTPSAAEVPSLKNERKKHSRKSNLDKMEENEMNLATKAGEETTAPMPKKRKAPQKGGDKETTKRKKIVGEKKDGESSRTSDKAEGRETEGEKQKQEKEGGNELKERGTESREKRDSVEKSDGDQNQLTERENADQLNTETTKQQQKEKESVAKGENKEGRDSETEKADEKQKETQKKASTSSDQISGQNLLLKEIATKTEGQQKEEQMPTMKLTEKKQQKTAKSKAKTETMAEKTNEKSNGKSGHLKPKTHQKKTPQTAYSSMASAQAQHQYQSNNNTNINQQQQQQQQFQLGQLQQHLSSVVGPPPMGGGVPSPFGPSQIPFAPQMAAAYAPFLQNFMQNGGAATTSSYADTFSTMFALLQQQRQPPTPQQQHQLGQMFAGRMMGMASAAAANASAGGGKVPTTTQPQKAPATAKVTATNGTGGRGMPSMANGGSTTTKANSENNGTKSSKSGGGGGGTKSPVKALPTMGRGEDRPSMVGKAPTSGGKSGGGGHPMTNGTAAEQMKQQQQKTATLPG
ncbi:hypothetical protein niasHT_019450 [Heterodera trifolii]|uniref:Uncharacterized protein n=1 Tax=Heterodera trifolii TaxID=157864 RepID=A0ABD2KVT0_9BILA